LIREVLYHPIIEIGHRFPAVVVSFAPIHADRKKAVILPFGGQYY